MPEDQMMILGLIFGFVAMLVLVGRRARKKPSSAPLQNPFNARRGQKLATPRTIKGRAYIVDGDTITVQNTQIRLFGIDAPELDHPFGIKAKWALHKLCKGHEITATITHIDHYGRTVATCRLPDGTDISAEMVKLGLALDWPKFSNGMYARYECADARKRLFLADARMKGRMHVWRKYEAWKQDNP